MGGPRKHHRRSGGPLPQTIYIKMYRAAEEMTKEKLDVDPILPNDKSAIPKFRQTSRKYYNKIVELNQDKVDKAKKFHAEGKKAQLSKLLKNPNFALPDL